MSRIRAVPDHGYALRLGSVLDVQPGEGHGLLGVFGMEANNAMPCSFDGLRECRYVATELLEVSSSL